MTSTTELEVIKFLTSKISSKYRITSVLISDNYPQFAGKKLKWFARNGILNLGTPQLNMYNPMGKLNRKIKLS